MNYFYTKRRADFGKPCHFSSQKPQIVISIQPEPELADQYVYKRFMSKDTQTERLMSVNEVNSEQAVAASRGINHAEGGWPKDVNPQDEEQVERFRRRVIRDDLYVDTMKRLTSTMEHAVLQNNVINIYETYFENVDKSLAPERGNISLKDSFHCPVQGMVNNLAWQPGLEPRFLVTIDGKNSYCWDVNNPIQPYETYEAVSPLTCAAYIPRDSYRFASGLQNGQIGFWDTRVGKSHIELTPPEYSHRGTVNALVWVASKKGLEFFTAGGGGLIKWWDREALHKPTDSMYIGYPITKIEYDTGAPTKYIVGTANGLVICGNRRGETLAEKLPWRMKTGVSPILGLQKNPVFNKNFLVVSQRIVMVWSEMSKDSCIIATPSPVRAVTCAEWSPARPSLIVAGKEDGCVDVWDLLISAKTPVCSLPLSKHGIKTMTFHEHGECALFGDEVGVIFLVEFSKSLSRISQDEKAELGLIFDLEAEKERLLDSKTRELVLQRKREATAVVSHENDSVAEGEESEEPNEQTKRQQMLDEIESAYEKTINEFMGRDYDSAGTRPSEYY